MTTPALDHGRLAGSFRSPSGRELATTGALIAVLLLTLMASGLLGRIDTALYDQLIGTAPHAPNPQILIVTIDDKSLQALGRWPWSARTHAAFLDRLTAAGDTTVALDLPLTNAESDPHTAPALAEAIRSHGRVILPVMPATLVDAPGLTAGSPLPLVGYGATLAHAQIETDADGIVRRTHLRGGLGSPSLPALGLAMMQARAGVTAPAAAPRPARSADVNAWVSRNEVLIPFVGPAGTYPHASYVDVLMGWVTPEQLHGKYIIVGTSTPTLGTRFATPSTLASRVPMTSAELNANLLDALLSERAITQLAAPWQFGSALLWVAAGLLLLRGNTNRLLLGTGAQLAAVTVLTILTARYLDLWLAPAPAVVGLLTLGPAWGWRRLRSLLDERGQSHATLELVHDGIITLDAAGRARYLNGAAEAITGQTLAQTLGRPLNEITGLRPVDPVLARLYGGDVDPLQIATHTLTTPDGAERSVRIARHPLPHNGGSVIAITDVTANMALVQQIAFQATQDRLTRLPNRFILEDRLGQMIASARRGNHLAGVLFIDLDGFKKVNDGLGHAAGDLLLREVGNRLGSRIRAEDTAARWGGDEFIILLSHLDDEHSAVGFAESIIALLEQPFDLDGQPAFVSASVGISLFPRDGQQVDQLLLRADTAMYRAKKDGGRCAAIFSHELGAWNRARLSLENDLRASVKNGPLDVVYQPVVDLKRGRVAHVEALIRWEHPEHGLHMPSQLLPLAESSGLIHDIGAQTLRIACADVQRLTRHGLGIGVAVNVSPQQLMRGDLPDLVVRVLAESGLPPHRLMLEVTESGILSNGAAANTFHALRNLGVAIALDDFGSGKSSLSLLRDFPVDILKIDRSFLPGTHQQEGDLTIPHAIIGMARKLDKAVVAEGVENAWQSRALLIGGCHLQQGFLHGKPATIDQIPAVARRIARDGAPTITTA